MSTSGGPGPRYGVCASPRRQRGIAMLVAILLVALGTIVAAAIAYESAMSARRSTATFSFDEAVLITQGAEALAAYGLRAVMQSGKSSGTSTTGTSTTGTGISGSNQFGRSGTGNTGTGGSNSGGGTGDIYPSQPWAQPVGPLEVVPGVMLEAQLQDLQGRFNLNWLGVQVNGQADPTAVKAFNRLLESLQIETKWTDLLIDWIDQNQQPLPDGAEDSAYLSQTPPYLTANQFITSSSELLALPGFGHDRFAKLARFVTALPPSTTLNICTAPGLVLDAFSNQEEYGRDEEAFEKTRASAGGCFPTKATFEQGLAAQSKGQQTSRFGTSSNYFRLTSLVTIGTSEFNLYSLLYVDTAQRTHVVMRTYTAD